MAPVVAAAPLPFDALLDAYAKENPQPKKTLDERAATLRHLKAAVGHNDALRIGKAEVRKWKEMRLAQGRSIKTIADGVAMLRPVWTWGAANGLLPEGPNPFSGMASKVAKRGPPARLPFDDEEAATILKAARKERGFLRWLPWVLAFTGYRLEEACGVRREDVRQVRGVWCLDIHPERDGTGLKTPDAQRYVPLHPALVAEGFMAYAQGLPEGSPLFPDVVPGFYGGRGENVTKRYGRWVRSFGIKDRRKAPAHSWRHRMADALRFAEVPQEARDALLGHYNAANAGAGYGEGWRARPDRLVIELAKVPSPVATERQEGGSLAA